MFTLEDELVNNIHFLTDKLNKPVVWGAVDARGGDLILTFAFYSFNQTPVFIGCTKLYEMYKSPTKNFFFFGASAF